MQVEEDDTRELDKSFAAKPLLVWQGIVCIMKNNLQTTLLQTVLHQTQEAKSQLYKHSTKCLVKCQMNCHVLKQPNEDVPVPNTAGRSLLLPVTLLSYI